MGQIENPRQAFGTMSSQPINVRSLKEPIECQGWADWKKQSISLPFTRDALNRKDMETVKDASQKLPKKAGVAVSTSDKTDFKTKTCIYINKKKSYSITASAHKTPQRVYIQ